MNRDHARRIYDFQQIRQMPLTAVLERYGLLGQMKRIGAQLFSSCPIHRGSGKNKKQFVVDPAKNVWKCFGDCNRGGSTIELVSAIERIESRAAAELIARWFAIGSSITAKNHAQQRRSTMSGRPTMKAFVVEDKEEGSEEKPFWTRVGSAWPHGDGKGLNIQLASGVAVSGRVVLREYTDKDAEEDEKKGSKSSVKKK